ncbi:MAG TPA: hypothetical protein VMF06_05260 [Candidatus Limnocylindria bacterium]|nr:hypothetical protein [Candidatus Limnocylindria bacterium]
MRLRSPGSWGWLVGATFLVLLAAYWMNWKEAEPTDVGRWEESNRRLCAKYLAMIAVPDEKVDFLHDAIRRITGRRLRDSQAVREEGLSGLLKLGMRADAAVPALMKLLREKPRPEAEFTLAVLAGIVRKFPSDYYHGQFVALCAHLMEDRLPGSSRLKRSAAEFIIELYPRDATKLGVPLRFPDLQESLDRSLLILTNDPPRSSDLPEK